MSMSYNNDMKDILKKAIDNWNKGDLEGYLQIYAPDVNLHGYPGVEPGLESIKRFYKGFWNAFPSVRIAIDDVITQGDKLACRFTTTGIHKGQLLGIPATGKSVRFTGITILQFNNNGKCIERWSDNRHRDKYLSEP